MVFLFAKLGSMASANGKVNGQAMIPPPNEKVATIVIARQRRNFNHSGRREIATQMPATRRKFVKKRTNWKPHVQFSAWTGLNKTRLRTPSKNNRLFSEVSTVLERRYQSAPEVRTVRAKEKNIASLVFPEVNGARTRRISFGKK